jgi:hypothetical protein
LSRAERSLSQLVTDAMPGAIQSDSQRRARTASPSELTPERVTPYMTTNEIAVTASAEAMDMKTT